MNQLPRGTDYSFHRTERSFRERMKQCQASLLGTLGPVVDATHQTGNLPWSKREMDDEDRMSAITEACDVSVCLPET